MPFEQTFPNGLVLSSSALSDNDMTVLMQQATSNCFGLMNEQPFTGDLIQGQNTVTLSDVTGIGVGFLVNDTPGYGVNLYGQGNYGQGGNIPQGTTVTAILNDVITLSNNITGSQAAATIFFSNPITGRLVRQAWPSEGAPAWKKGDDVTFVRCTQVDDWYNKVRDQGSSPVDNVSASLNTEYTRVWRVFWELRGPNSDARAALLKSAMQLDFIHDSLAAFGVYLMPAIASPVRAPELEDARWWSRTDLEMVFYEQVNESTTLPTVASIEIIVENNDGVKLDFVVS